MPRCDQRFNRESCGWEPSFSSGANGCLRVRMGHPFDAMWYRRLASQLRKPGESYNRPVFATMWSICACIAVIRLRSVFNVSLTLASESSMRDTRCSNSIDFGKSGESFAVSR